MSIRWQSKERGEMKKKKATAKTKKQGKKVGKPRIGRRAGDAQLRKSVDIYVEMKTRRTQLEILHGILMSATKNPGKSAIFPHTKGDVNILAALNRVNNINTVECDVLADEIKDMLVERVAIK